MSDNLGAPRISSGQSTKYVTANDMAEALDAALTEITTIDLSTGDATLNATQYAAQLVLKAINVGSSSDNQITLPAAKKLSLVLNAGTNTLSLILGSTTLTLGAGAWGITYSDGTTNGLYSVGGGGGGGGPGTVSANSLLGNNTGSPALGASLSVAQVLAMLDLAEALPLMYAVVTTAIGGPPSGSVGTVDGLTPPNGCYLLLTAEATASENGPWVYNSAGLWTRPTWWPSGGAWQAYQGQQFDIANGVLYGGSKWYITTSGAITIDTTALTIAYIPRLVPVVAGALTSGALSASQVVAQIVFGRTTVMPAGLPGVQGILGAPATAATTFTLYKNVTSIGTLQFAASDSVVNASNGTITFASAVTFSPGDVLTITGPSSPDATAASPSFNIPTQQ